MKRLRAALDNRPSGPVSPAARSRRTLHIVLTVVLAVQIAGTAIVVGSAGGSWRLDLSASGDVEVRDFCPLPATIFGTGEFHTIIGDPPRPLPDDDDAPPAEDDPSESDDKREPPDDGHGGLSNGPSNGPPGHAEEAQEGEADNDSDQRSEPIFISAGTMELGIFSLWLELSSELPESYADAPIDAGTVRLTDLRLNRMIGPYAVARETGDENGNGQPDRRIDFVLDDLYVARGGESGSSLMVVTGRAEGCDFRASGQLLVDFPEPGEGEMPGASSGGSACEASEDEATAAATPSACSEAAPPADAGGTPTAEPAATATPECVPTPDAPCLTASPQADPTDAADATPSVEPSATIEATVEPTAVADDAVAPAESTPATDGATPAPSSTPEPVATEPVDEPGPTTEPVPTAEPEATPSPDPNEEEIATETP